jgi:hypothetical protein
MAVEIVNSGNKEYLEVLYHFNEEKLTLFNQTLFNFDESTASNIIFLEERYSAIKVHITKKLHQKSPNNRTFDMVIEFQGTEELTKKLFVCIGLEFNRSGGTFDMKTTDFDSVFSKFNSTVLYQTKTGNFVFVSNYTLLSAGDAPIVTMSAKASYKEIIEPDSFNVLSTVEVAKHSLQKVETKTSYVVFKPLPVDSKVKEGFLTGDGSYMECKLLKEDATDRNTVFEDVAVVPLKTNTYERGMVTFSHFLHFFLVSFGAGVGFPNLLVTVFKLEDFQTHDKLRNVFRFGSFIAFFLVGLIIMIIGLADPKYTSKKKNNVPIIEGSVMATVGFYLILVHCSFALGMFTFKNFGQAATHNKFNKMFNVEQVNSLSFFDILNGLR